MKENNFDLLRVVAALQVMTMHTFSHILYNNGYTTNGLLGGGGIKLLAYIEGVPIFFLISGFFNHNVF